MVFPLQSRANRKIGSSTTATILTLTALLAIVVLPSVTAAEMLTETFEGQTTGSTPTGWFTGGSGTITTSTAHAHAGSKGAAFTATAGNTADAAIDTGVNLCTTGNELRFWWFFASLPPSNANGNYAAFYLQNPSAPFVQQTFYVTDTGQFRHNNGGATFTTLASSVPTSTWIDVRLTTNCGTGQFTITSNVLGVSSVTLPAGNTASTLSRFVLRGAGNNDLINGHVLNTFTDYVDDFGIISSATVQVDLPTNGQVVSPGTVSFSGSTVSDPTNAVDRIKFTVSGAGSGTCTETGFQAVGPPAPCTMSLTTPGSYTVVADPEDSSAASVGTSINSPVFTIPSNGLTVTSPATGSTVGQGTQAYAVTNVGVTPNHVRYVITAGPDNAKVCTGATAPSFGCSIFLNQGAGSETVTATSYSSSDNSVSITSGTSTYTVAANSLAITSPGGNIQAGIVVFASSFTGLSPDHVTYTLTAGGDTGTCTATANVAAFGCTITLTHAGSETVGATAYDSSNTALPGETATKTYVVIGSILTPDQSKTVATGTGFHVDPTGATIITRQGAGNNVVTYAGGGAMPLLGSTPTNCNRQQGVFSISTHVVYIQCDPDDASVVESYNIRAPDLTAPSQPSICTGAGFCLADIPDASSFGQGALAGNHDPDERLTGLEDFPINYQNTQEPQFDSNEVFMAFGYTTTAGNAGVVTYTMVNNQIDRSDFTQKAVGTQTLAQMCEFRDGSGATAGHSYLYAADTNSNVKGFEITFTKDTSGGSVGETGALLVPHMTEVFSGTPATAGPRGIGCGNGKFAIAAGGDSPSLTLWNRGELTPYKTIALSSTPTSGSVEMSADGGWVGYSYLGQSQVDIYNTTTGSLTTTTSNPSHGAFVGMGFQGHACNLWEMTTTDLVRWNLVGTGLPGGTTCTSYTEAASGSSGHTAAGIDVTDTSGAGAVGTSGFTTTIGSSDCGLGFFFGSNAAVNAIGCMFLFLVVPFMAIGISIGGRIGGAVGAGVGLVMAIVGGKLPGIVTFLLVLGAVIIGAIRFGNSKGAPAESGE